jgi:hypothetical protein
VVVDVMLAFHDAPECRDHREDEIVNGQSHKPKIDKTVIFLTAKYPIAFNHTSPDEKSLNTAKISPERPAFQKFQ